MSAVFRRRIAALLVLASLAACGGARRDPATPVASSTQPAASPAASPTFTLTIVGTNDLHGGILERDGRGGLALLGGYVKILRAARARDGGAVLLVDAGDMFQGTLESNLSEGASVVAAYNALGYAAAAIGNHEFDFGPVGPAATPQSASDDPRGALKARAAEAKFPFLAANIIDAATNKPIAWPNVMPSTTVTAAGVRVGIIGLVTRGALSATIASNTVGLRIAPLAETIEAEAPRLRAAGADVIIVTAHAGGRCTAFDNPEDLSSCDQNAEMFQVARQLPSGLVDAIVGGHSHAPIGHQVAGIPISEANSGGRSFGRIDLEIDPATKRVMSRKSFAPIDLAPGTYESATIVPDTKIAGVLAPAVESARALKASAVGITLTTPIRRAGVPESPLGNLFTDAYLAAVPGADVAFNNTSGGLRADLPAGPLSYGALFEVMPFDNRIVAFHLAGADVRKIAAAQASRRGALVGMSGLRVVVTCDAGAPMVALLRPNGTPVRDSDRLLIATTDFLATGGDGLFASVTPPNGLTIERDAGAARDVVAAWLKARGGTLSEAELVDASKLRWTLPGPQPVACR
ncbi:MAG TPA: bifunctional UDP-sugar hydrolase/5'-nucleotidase [Vicinamibacterales bacterium]|nr:bifunctional UDP-sugar hydrolase/5'-nucleotidase [Vicinamibacterales bacterium]